MIELHYYERIDGKYKDDAYISQSGEIEFKRTPTGNWGYYKNGLILDTDQYRYDLAARNNFQLLEIER